MKRNIKVTIGFCVKNAEATVGQAIDSVLNQDFPRESMEIIVVDGYSKDRTLDVVKSKLENSEINSKIFCEKNGLGYARQMVVDNAQGDFIVWVDADMVLSPNFVSKQVYFMEQTPKAGIAKGRYGIFKENSLVGILEDLEFALTFRNEGETNLSLGISGCIYRVKALKQVGGFDTTIRGAGEDTEVENRIKLAGWALYVTPAIFYEKRRSTWRSLWNEYFWHGVGASYVSRKNPRVIKNYKMFPPLALFTEFLRVPSAYKLTGRGIAFLLPFHYIFKRMAWFFGFMKERL